MKFQGISNTPKNHQIGAPRPPKVSKMRSKQIPEIVKIMKKSNPDKYQSKWHQTNSRNIQYRKSDLFSKIVSLLLRNEVLNMSLEPLPLLFIGEPKRRMEGGAGRPSMSCRLEESEDFSKDFIYKQNALTRGWEPKEGDLEQNFMQDVYGYFDS